MNLQTAMVDHLDLGHTEPEVDHRMDSEHKEHISHYNEMDWENFTEADMDADNQCPLGYARVGCCKCVLDVHAGAAHLTGEERIAPTIHGMSHEVAKANDQDIRGSMYGGKKEYETQKSQDPKGSMYGGKKESETQPNIRQQ